MKDWSSFQSYKDRNPPWIRLHKRLLDNFKFQSMSVQARALLPMLWLMASEDKNPSSGMLRIGYEEITFRLRGDILEIKQTIEEIIRAGFIERTDQEQGALFPDNSDSYIPVTESSRNHHSETEAETETDQKYKKGLDLYFQEFWKYCPRQERMENTEKQFYEEVKNGVEPERIIKAMRNHFEDMKNKHKKFVPMPDKWLREKRYRDPIDERTEIDSSGWEKWKKDLASRIGKDKVFAWFNDSKLKDKTITVKNNFAINYIKTNYDIDLQRVLGFNYNLKIETTQDAKDAKEKA